MFASIASPRSLSHNADSVAAIDCLQHLHKVLAAKKRRSDKSARQLMPVYWRKLIEVGVPIDTAKLIAWAIARYEVAQISPTVQQQLLLQQYCRFICRAGLWQANLLQ